MRALLATLTVAMIACGGRSYEVLIIEVPADTSGTGGAPSSTANGGDGGAGGAGGGVGGAMSTGMGGSASSTTTGEGGGGFNPIDCLTCIGQSCPEFLACIQDPVCGQGLFCTFGQCLAGGQPDFPCVLECFGGDLNAAGDALQAMSCVLDTCGDSCGGVFPGLPGG